MSAKAIIEILDKADGAIREEFKIQEGTVGATFKLEKLTLARKSVQEAISELLLIKWD